MKVGPYGIVLKYFHSVFLRKINGVHDGEAVHSTGMGGGVKWTAAAIFRAGPDQ